MPFPHCPFNFWLQCDGGNRITFIQVLATVGNHFCLTYFSSCRRQGNKFGSFNRWQDLRALLLVRRNQASNI